MTWETTGAVPTITRAEAEIAIKKMAVDQGIDGTFKCFYDGVMIATPSQLPEQVDMSKVRVSEVMNQAACAKKPAKKAVKKNKK